MRKLNTQKYFFIFYWCPFHQIGEYLGICLCLGPSYIPEQHISKYNPENNTELELGIFEWKKRFRVGF